MPVVQENDLTEAERIAKRQFNLYYEEAYNIPCDIDDIDVLPDWYDEAKYKRGQQYFQQNRIGIMNSNFVGLICLLTEPKGLAILSLTGKSSCKETARKRYISTVLHTLSWYDIDLAPGSESRKSLAMVRKLHFAASKSAAAKNIGHITQTELALTAYGFMGLVLIRPKVLGIQCDNREDCEAFVHLWAVLCNMIGVKDKYNICLLPFDALIVLCQMFTRYVLIPLIQIETPQFKQMTQAMLDGLSDVLPHMDYDAQMFTAKLVLGLPGYQYKVDHSAVALSRTLLCQQELDKVNAFLTHIRGNNYLRFTVDIPIIEVLDVDKFTPIRDSNMNTTNWVGEFSSVMDDWEKEIHASLELKGTKCVKIYYIDYEEEWSSILSDKRYGQLSEKAQRIISLKSYGRLLLDYKLLRYLSESLMSLLFVRMKRQGKNAAKSKAIPASSSICSRPNDDKANVVAGGTVAA